jgi:hypothetical protein
MPTNYYALYSIVFAIGFVIVFDGVHRKNRAVRQFRSMKFFSSEEVSRIKAIWLACQDV